MLDIIPMIAWPVFGYLIGSVPSAVITAKLFNLDDPRTSGSGNPGATNMLRTGSKMAALLTLLGDVLKGFIPVVLAQTFDAGNSIIALVAIAAFMGHLFSLFLGFKGGKGVATAIGVFAALSWQLVAVFIAVWVLMAAISRYSSLAALVASAASGLASFAIFNSAKLEANAPSEVQIIGAVVLIVAFLFQRHRGNLDRLRNNTETKIGQKNK